MLNRTLKTVLALASLALPGAAVAMDNPVHMTVLEGWRQQDGTHIAAIQIDLDEGWKTYWRAPGDGGIPPVFDFVRSGNLVDFEVEWPTPIVFDQGGLRSIGYKERVILPITFTPRRDHRDIRLRGEVEIGVCKDVCIPVTLDISAVLASDAANKRGVISAARASVPYSAEEAGVNNAVCKLASKAGELEVVTRIDLPSTGGEEYVVLESANQDHWLSETQSTRMGTVLETRGSLVSMSGGPVAISRSDLRITVLGEDYAVDIQGCTGS